VSAPGPAFLDTNILVYAQQDGPKAEIARRIVAEGGVVSVQVLNEFAQVARRKLGRSWAEIADAVADVVAATAPPLPLTLDLHDEARRIAETDGLSFYDALIVAAALNAGCGTLLTEDMQAGRRFGPLAIVDPFDGAA
jgi:predicted nucleic acid-binding protein